MSVLKLLINDFEQTQWLDRETIAAAQFDQLERLLAHSRETVPYYRSQLIGIPHAATQLREAWSQIPITTRQDVQLAGSGLHSERLPAGHAVVGQTASSGSTGRPLLALTTEITDLFWRAFTLRDHFWHRRDFQGKLAVIRSFSGPEYSAPNGYQEDNWGLATKEFIQTGPCVMLDVRCTLEEQADWLLQQDPDYLLTHPSIVKGLAQQFIGSSKKLSRLKQVRTFGEVVSEEVRSGCRLAWNVPVTDAYSAAESGYLALQCPEYEHYHVQSEGVLIEILNDDGKPSQPGEIGRLLLTTLTNYAMPLIRYEIGDYAEVGEQCACGRGLPVLKRILGRERNICVLPNGQHRWPSLGTESFEARIADFPPIQQFQLVQRTSHAMELFLVMHRKLSVDEDTMVQGWVREAVGYPFDVTIRYVDSVSRNSGNKFEDFRCEMAKLEPARCTNP